MESGIPDLAECRAGGRPCNFACQGGRDALMSCARDPAWNWAGKWAGALARPRTSAPAARRRSQAAQPLLALPPCTVLPAPGPSAGRTVRCCGGSQQSRAFNSASTRPLQAVDEQRQRVPRCCSTPGEHSDLCCGARKPRRALCAWLPRASCGLRRCAAGVDRKYGSAHATECAGSGTGGSAEAAGECPAVPRAAE